MTDSITETEIENLLALFGLRRVRNEPDKNKWEWDVYKGDRFITSWNFDSPLQTYINAIIRLGL